MNDSYLHGHAECLNCGHEWIAVWPLGCPSLECPKCGDNDTVRDSVEPGTPTQANRFRAH